MEIKPIKSTKDYDFALKEIERLWDARKNTPEYDKLDILITLVDAYENKHFPIETPDPIEAIKSVMEEKNLKSVDLGNWIGGRNRATEILNKKRKLTLDMIRKINKKLGISTEILIKDYKIKNSVLKNKVKA
ncbi:helix-turn-helix domain-containing protein [Leptospira alstonii]|uniref:Toxin-antitoxin system, antitoxin component, Xre family n=2 Tax=Leptospira alstonii TaxID=28452 RepID=M6D760_9LEPT|nr:toxin-antitoxin system antitoxin component Xre family [Leptospira alstonii]EMJ94395.1 toxin-antitoxin system, antitoxin component, Xre family [Leptospira alstonii serovar Sichuan str. 79601]EQA82563.1 toxin-antitoxin system, antitoxin component, Xre family [Leptospira alstonii serovar Pingchang str. 80-412]